MSQAFYDSQGKYAEAEPLYQRALAIWEKATPAVSQPSLSEFLSSIFAWPSISIIFC
jgi:hypothetical protein